MNPGIRATRPRPRTPAAGRRHVAAEYTRGRTRDGPLGFFEARDEELEPGYLQVDAHAGYDSLFASNAMVEFGCWSYTRRGFYDAMSTAPDETGYVLATIRRLYDFERQAKDQDFDDGPYRVVTLDRKRST